MSSPTSPTKAPLAIEDKPHNEMEPGVTTMNVDGIAVKLDALGPMIINTDGTMSRITNWEELSQIERDRTVRLLVKKRNLVRMGQIAKAEGGNGEKVTALKEAEAADK